MPRERPPRPRARHCPGGSGGSGPAGSALRLLGCGKATGATPRIRITARPAPAARETYVQISITRPSELGAAEIARWHWLQRETGTLGNPYLSPEFAIAVDHFRPDARLAVLADGPAIAGFFPFQRRRFGVGVPIAAGLTDCQGLIHAPGVEWNPPELLRACKLTEWQFDHLVTGQVPFQRYVSAVVPSPVIDLTDGFVAYREKLRVKSPRFGSDVARKARRLAREAGALGFVADSDDVTVLRTLMKWKSDQYHRNGWVDVFARPWIADLINYLFSVRSDGFGGLLSVLYAGQTPVAAHFGIRSGPILAHWFPAYDVRFAAQSPGLIQHLRMAEETPALGIGLIDMGTGPERYKHTLKSHDLFVGEGVVTRGALSARAHRVRTAQTDWARRQVKRHPALFRAADRLLRRTGRIG
jgi:CelD/BcsL family acetyltransferase involved in cellulose biosynthesis